MNNNYDKNTLYYLAFKFFYEIVLKEFSVKSLYDCETSEEMFDICQNVAYPLATHCHLITQAKRTFELDDVFDAYIYEHKDMVVDYFRKQFNVEG